ncbi:UNVERIFIED_CONTAM: DUF1445 domain-containing protein [Kocuria sp. CPCC 205316]|uniref:D-glutamate cyclase family protein n=1 Tax=Kocuria TaxID=57493 RepID=UPI0036DAC8CE
MFRSGLVTPASGWCDGFAQANLIVVPKDWAFDVLLFAQRNPEPCPVLGVLEAGEVTGPLVVSMRPIPASRVADAVRITSRCPAVHGAPVHVGAPGELGIRDLAAPHYGDAVQIPDGHVPVFRACGVTPQAAVLESGVPFALGHAPGRTLVTDLPNCQYQVP